MTRGRAVEGLPAVVVLEGVESLVHPGVQSLVIADDHRPPAVPHLVVGHAEEPGGADPVAAKDDHRIFHPSFDAVDVRHRGVGIPEPPPAIELDGVLHVLGRAVPDRIGRGGIETLGEHPPAVGADGVPDEVPRGGPGKVPHAVGGEAPGQRASYGARTGACRADLLLPADHHRRRTPAGGGEPALLRRGKHGGGIPEGAGRADQHVGRDGEAHVERTVLEVELPLAIVLLGIPPPHVVVHRHPRVPLCHLVDVAAVHTLHAHPIGVGAEGEGPGDVDLELPSRRQRARQVEPHHRAVHERGDRSVPGDAPAARDRHEADADAREPEPSIGPRRPESCALVEDQRSSAVRPEDVLVELQPDVPEGVGGVVGVGDGLLSREHLPRGVERSADDVVGALLPVFLAGRSRAGPDVGRRGERQPVEWRDLVGDWRRHRPGALRGAGLNILGGQSGGGGERTEQGGAESAKHVQGPPGSLGVGGRDGYHTEQSVYK